MRVEIFNVEHGQCAVVTAPNGRRMMIDCGRRLGKERWWSPSMRYLTERIDVLALTNLDEDHLEDFEGMLKYVQVGGILTNPSIGAAQLRTLKTDGFGSGTKAFLDVLASQSRSEPSAFPDFGELDIWWFWSNYDAYSALSFHDTNNLSLVISISYGPFRIMFSGDIEEAGWRAKMTHPTFREQLKGTTVFVASHHGRANGQSSELFDAFRPDIVLISDSKRQYATQETDAWYRERCNGVPLTLDPTRRRYVMTTRNDGDMQIDVDLQRGLWTLTAVDVPDWAYAPPRHDPPNPFATLFGAGMTTRK